MRSEDEKYRQGRRKDQAETNELLAMFGVLGLVAVLIVIQLMKLFS